jgi:autotransporter-associated beta strand protein
MVLNAANGDIRLVGTNASLTGTITKTGSGTFTLGSGSGSNFSGIGGITVNDGTFITNAVTANQLVGATINSGGTLQWAGSNKHQDNALFTINAGGILDLITFSVTIGAIAGAGSITSATAASMTLSGGTQAFSGVIGGAVSLTLNLSPSSSALTLTGTNAFTGTTTITAGSLQLGNGGGSGNLGLITGITNNSNLTINRSNAFDQSIGLNGQAIVGTGSFTQAGAGATTLTANNTFTGATNISAGSLVLGHVTALGGNNPGVNGTSSISMATGTTLRSTISGVTISAPITTTGSATVGAPDNDAGQAFSELILNGALGGAGTTNVDFRSFFNKNTIQTVTLGAASNYAGTTTIGAVTAGTDSQVFVKLGIDNALPTTTILSIQGGTGNGTGRGAGLNLFGFNQTLAGLTNTAASLRVQEVVNSNVSAYATLTINGSTDTTYSGNLGRNAAGFSVNATAMPGSTNGNNFGLTKDGIGKFTLSGTNTYTGDTVIKAGTLKINTSTTIGSSRKITVGDTGSSGTVLDATTAGLTVGASQTLAGIGQVLATGQTVSIAGTIAPGNSPGTLLMSVGALDLENGTALAFELNPSNTTVGSAINDLVAVTGNLNLDGLLSVVATSGNFLTVVANTSWRLFNYSGTLTDDTLGLGSMPSLGSGLSWSINTATTGQVNLVVIPEPRAALLGGLGLLALLRRRRN